MRIRLSNSDESPTLFSFLCSDIQMYVTIACRPVQQNVGDLSSASSYMLACTMVSLARNAGFCNFVTELSAEIESCALGRNGVRSDGDVPNSRDGRAFSSLFLSCGDTLSPRHMRVCSDQIPKKKLYKLSVSTFDILHCRAVATLLAP